jgi:AcrR family transcriptional regulator
MAKQERAIRTRNALVGAAAELFDRDGFESASLATISARAGVSSGALHFHFASKVALLDAVVTEAGERLRWITRQRDTHALQVLIDASHDLVRSLAQDVVLRAGFGLSSHSGRGGVRDLRGEWQSWVEVTAEQAAREEMLSPDVATRDLTTAVVAMAAGLECLGGQDRRWLERATLTRVWTLLLRCVAGPAAEELFVAAGRGGSGPAPYEVSMAAR